MVTNMSVIILFAQVVSSRTPLCCWQPSRLRDKTLLLNVESYMYVVRTSIQVDIGACIVRVKIQGHVEKSSANSFQFVFDKTDIKKF